MAWVYLLHFGLAVEHAEHYCGCCGRLRRRLERHARGTGAALCRELLRRGIPWELVAAWLCPDGEQFAYERLVKRQHNNRRFCPLCTDIPARLGDATPVDLELLGFPLTSTELLEG